MCSKYHLSCAECSLYLKAPKREPGEVPQLSKLYFDMGGGKLLLCVAAVCASNVLLIGQHPSANGSAQVRTDERNGDNESGG